MSEPFAVGSLKWVGEKVLDLLAERVEKRIFEELNPELVEIHQDLKDIRSTQEEMLIGPLLEGLTLARLHELNKATDKLIEAESRNPYAPVPKVWLAVMLSRMQKDREKAVQLLSEALGLNPYYILDSATQLGAQLSQVISRPVCSGHRTESKVWALSLEERSFNAQLASRFRWPKRILQKYLRIPGFYEMRSTAAIARASVCGNKIALQWYLAHNLRHKTEAAIGLIDHIAPDPLWVQLNPRYDLVFLSYQHVVVHQPSRNLFCLLDPNNGSLVKRMSENYFNVMFGGWKAGALSSVRSNWLGTTPAVAYQKSSQPLEREKSITDSILGHYAGLYRESASLCDPCGADTQEWKVSNEWDHLHIAGSPNSGPPTCRLRGGGQVECGSVG
jgi:hypothetical protein